MKQFYVFTSDGEVLIQATDWRLRENMVTFWNEDVTVACFVMSNVQGWALASACVE